jgi:hypothetical protein
MLFPAGTGSESDMRHFTAKALSVAAIAFLAPTPAVQAHSWYPMACCGGSDCRPLPGSAVHEKAGVGYVIDIPGAKQSIIIPYGDARIKIIPAQFDDGETSHICTNAGLPDSLVICVFMPGRGT